MHPEGRTLRVFTNGGFMDSKMVGKFGDIDVWYNPKSIANILSLALIVDTFQVTLDSRKEHAFALWLDPHSYIKFVKENRLFVYNAVTDHVFVRSKDETEGVDHNKEDVTLLQTVSMNERQYRRREIESAKVAQDVSKLLFHPAQSKFEKIISGNFIANAPITLADVRRAEKIYGPSVPSIRGRTTRRQPAHVQDLIPVGIPRDLYEEYKNVTLCLDFLFVNKLPVLHAISRKLCHRWISFPESRVFDSLKKHFDAVRRVYHSRGFRIVTVHADEEFEKLRNYMLPCHLITPDPGGHVPEVERSIRTLKEGCRAAIHGMPYTILPKEMVRGILRKVVLLQNAFPADHGVSDTLSPRNLVDNLPNLDFHSIKIPFGAYAQIAVDEQITNTPRPRTIGCLVLDPVGVNQKYRFMALESGRRVSGRLVRLLPITDEVINRVNTLGSEQRQPRIHDGRLLFEWRPGVLVDGDGYMIEGFDREPNEVEGEREEIFPEPLNENGNNEALLSDHEDMNAVTEDDDEDGASVGDVDSVSSEAEAENESESVVSSNNGEDSESNPDETGVSFDDNSYNDDLPINPTDDVFFDSDNLSISTDSASNDGCRNEDTAHEENTYGRGMRERRSNPKYFGNEFTHFQFLQQSFDSLDGESRAQYLKHALDDYCMSGKTQLLERYLTGLTFTQMSARVGLKKHGKDAEKVMLKEFQQFKNMDVMVALDPGVLTKKQISEALDMVNIIQEKRDHTPEDPRLKYRGCANGSKQRTLYTKEETTSPTSGVDSFLLTLMNDAMERRDVAIADVVGAYLHAIMKDFVVMRVTGREAELMCELNPEWKIHVRYNKHGRAVLYVRLKKALYGCVKSALLWYDLYSSTLKDMGFIINPYDQCVANKVINGKTCTICWYVDDNKISHEDPNIVTSIIEAIEQKFGKMSVSRGKEHEFLGMKIILKDNGTVSIDMKEYVKKAIDEFPEDIVKNASTPATRFLFDVCDDVAKLERSRAEVFHSTVAKLLYICKRSRLDIQNTVGFLTTRVSKSDEDDWKKLRRLLQYLRGSIDDKLILGAVDIGKMKSFVDASFAVHADMKSHTGGGISWGVGILLSMCQKQKLNSKSSTEAEIVGVSDFLPNMIWARMFLEHQGYEINENILYQDNQSAIKIEENGAKSCSKRSRHIDMRYFFIKDRLETENIKVVYCPTEHMVADFFTKPLQGKLFHYLKAIIMGHEPITKLTSKFWTEAQERVVSSTKEKDSVSSSPETGCLQDSKRTVKKSDVKKSVRFTDDGDLRNRQSYADVVRGVTGNHS